MGLWRPLEPCRGVGVEVPTPLASSACPPWPDSEEAPGALGGGFWQTYAVGFSTSFHLLAPGDMRVCHGVAVTWASVAWWVLVLAALTACPEGSCDLGPLGVGTAGTGTGHPPAAPTIHSLPYCLTCCLSSLCCKLRLWPPLGGRVTSWTQDLQGWPCGTCSCPSTEPTLCSGLRLPCF